MVRIFPCQGGIRAYVLHLREATGLTLKAQCKGSTYSNKTASKPLVWFG